jgi:hypothetical protein
VCIFCTPFYEKEKKMSRYELQKLYRKICKKSPEVYGNEDLWMENMADADCYTHDDGPVELTFTITEVNNMTPEEF